MGVTLSTGTLDFLVELLQLAMCLFVKVAKKYKVNRDIVLLELAGERDKGLFFFVDRGADEGDDACTLGLILAMLEGQLKGEMN